MEEVRTVRVQIEGLDDLRDLVRQIHRAAEAVTRAAESARRASQATAQDIATAINGAASHGRRKS